MQCTSNFNILKFEESKIIMQHRKTNKLYDYFEGIQQNNKWQNIKHKDLLQIILLPTGILYGKTITNMQNQLKKKINLKNNTSNILYSQQEIINTFIPVIQCLLYLHSVDIIHGNITPSNIVIDSDGDVKLKDGRIMSVEVQFYYPDMECESHHDIQALGQIILECSRLYKNKNYVNRDLLSVQNVLKTIVNRYTKGFLLALLVMLMHMNQYYNYLIDLFRNNLTSLSSSDYLHNAYRRICSEDNMKMVLNVSQLQTGLQLEDKKTPIKKSLRLDDENKRIYNQEIKKKLHQKMNKIDKNIIHQHKNISQYTLKKMSYRKQQDFPIQHHKINKEDLLKFGSPAKKIRNLSKKRVS